VPYTARQGRAAAADYGRVKRGQAPRTFKGMSESKLRRWTVAHHEGRHKKPKGRSVSRSSRR